MRFFIGYLAVLPDHVRKILYLYRHVNANKNMVWYSNR